MLIFLAVFFFCLARSLFLFRCLCNLLFPLFFYSSCFHLHMTFKKADSSSNFSNTACFPFSSHSRNRFLREGGNLHSILSINGVLILLFNLRPSAPFSSLASFLLSFSSLPFSPFAFYLSLPFPSALRVR